MLELWRRAISICALFILAFPVILSPLSADEVLLSTGGRIEGEIISQDSQQVVLQTAYGKVTFQTADISKVVHSSPLEKDLKLQLAGLAPSDIPGRLRLADAALSGGLRDMATNVYTQVIAIEPDERTARKALGYVLYDGEWVTQRERELHPGLVPYRGRWVKPDERESLRQTDAERTYFGSFGLSATEGQAQLDAINDIDLKIEPRGGYLVRRHVKTWPVKDKPYFYSTDIINWQRLGVFIGVSFLDASQKKVKGFGTLSYSVYEVKADTLGNLKPDKQVLSGTVNITPEMYGKESDFAYWDTKINSTYEKVVSDAARQAWADQEYMNAGSTIYVLANREIDDLLPPGVYYVEASFKLKDRVKKVGRYVQYQELR
jgi:hypothetical protein